MRELLINGLRNSKVLIGNNINIGSEICGYGKVLVVSDDNVFKIYGESVIKRLSLSNVSVYSFVVEHGEKSKSMEKTLEIINILSKYNFSRNDLIVTFGGGVVSDLGGFAASIYKRGIRLCNITTTVLGAVDASVGSKNGVNTEFGKNILGTFYNPLKTIIDINFFNTLPYEEVNNGKAEILKYVFIYEPKILNFLENNDWESTIESSIKTKRHFVENDELDVGERMILNFGHTVGHAIEKYSNYNIRHGEAVSIGMATMARCFGVHEIEDILRKNQLPVVYDVSEDELIRFVRMDKKRVGDIYNVVIPVRLGKCEVRQMDEEQIIKVLKKVKG